MTNIASVVSMNGAPRIAPMPISSPDSWPEAIAMIGRIVSGSAVPTAASTLPTTPSERPNPSPIHSTPFVNSSAPPRITTNETARPNHSIGAASSHTPPGAPRLLRCRCSGGE